MVVGLNLLLAGVSTGLAAWERHSSAADEEGSAMIFVCAAQFVNTFIVALLAFAHVPQVHFACITAHRPDELTALGWSGFSLVFPTTCISH